MSNFSIAQIERFRRAAQLHAVQPRYNLFEREIESELLPYCRNSGLGTVTYGAMCRGLLSGKLRENAEFGAGDLRRTDPKFRGSALRAIPRGGAPPRPVCPGELGRADPAPGGPLATRPGCDDGVVGVGNHHIRLFGLEAGDPLRAVSGNDRSVPGRQENLRDERPHQFRVVDRQDRWPRPPPIGARLLPQAGSIANPACRFRDLARHAKSCREFRSFPRPKNPRRPNRLDKTAKTHP